MTVEANKPQEGQEKPQNQPAKAVEAGVLPVNETAEDKDFNEKVRKKTDEYEKKVDDLHKKFLTGGSAGASKAEFLRAKQINRLRLAAGKKQDQFSQISAEEKAKRKDFILGEVEQELNKTYVPYESIVNHVRNFDKLDDQDLVKLEAILESMSKMKNNPQLEQYFFKVINKEKLNKQELVELVKHITPTDLGQNLDNPTQSGVTKILESSQVGAIIAMMGDEQRMELVNTILEQKPPVDYMPILETLITTGIISNLQLQDLIDKGKISEPYAGQLKAQLEDGSINKKQKDYREKTELLGTMNSAGSPENPLSKTVGAPAIMAAVGFWGLATALINARIHWQEGKTLGEKFGKAISAPYTILGGGVAAAAALGMSSVFVPKEYAQYKEKFIGIWDGPEQQKEKQADNKANLNLILEEQLKQNPYFTEFLNYSEELPSGQKKTGMEIIQEVVAEQKAQKKSVSFTFVEIQAKSGRKQKEILDKAYGAEGRTEVNFKERVASTMGIITAMELDKPEKLGKFTQELKKKQAVA